MGSNSFRASQRLINLAHQLHLYKPLSQLNSTDSTEDPTVQVPHPQEHCLKAESVTNQPERFRSNRAAVLICLFEDDEGDLRVILTKRSSTLSTHSGEVSLPGGKREESDADDDIKTALREAEEEIGLNPSLVNVVTVLEPFVTKRGMTVVPVIGILSDRKGFNPTPNAAEVEAIFDAPLEMFLKDENRRAEEREWMGDKYLLHFFDYEAQNKKYVVWALTAGFLITVASIVYQRPPAFPERKPKFWNRQCL
uniref:Nudix hydrolase domain-containing protein n=1 Tax=Davidia involucrata TaxID=16924 RepID=A0A5B7BTN7_DAVIN